MFIPLHTASGAFSFGAFIANASTIFGMFAYVAVAIMLIKGTRKPQ